MYSSVSPGSSRIVCRILLMTVCTVAATCVSGEFCGALCTVYMLYCVASFRFSVMLY